MEKIMCVGKCSKCEHKVRGGCGQGFQQYRNTYKYKQNKAERDREAARVALSGMIRNYEE